MRTKVIRSPHERSLHMRVLLDYDVPHGLRLQFPDEHEVVTAQYQGWADLNNGDLLQAAEGE